MPDEHNEDGRYRAFLVRLWPVRSGGRTVWRASAQDAHSGERRAFADVNLLFSFLEEAVTSDTTDPENKEHPDD